MASDNDKVSRTSKEKEIDYILAEELECDPVFAKRFAEACGLEFTTFVVESATLQPSLDEGGNGDVLVEAKMDGMTVAMIVEDKITAGPAPDQAKRYRTHAERLERDGAAYRAITVLVAPQSYKGERNDYHESVNLEQVVEMIDSSNPRRREYRRGRIKKALEKKITSDVKNPSLPTHKLHSDYREYMEGRCKAEGLPFEFPALKDEVHNDQAWVERIRHPFFTHDVTIRHRLWNSLNSDITFVDLIISNTTLTQRERLQASVKEKFPSDTVIEQVGKKESKIRVSIPVPAMRKYTGVNQESANKALDAMKRLTDWYREFSQMDSSPND